MSELMNESLEKTFEKVLDLPGAVSQPSKIIDS